MPILRFHPPTPISDPLGRVLPYVLRGREEEFTHIASALFDSHITMYTIEGPPGTGKTSLIGGLGAYASRRGYTVAAVQASEIDTPEKLGGRIWRALTKIHGAPEGIEKIKSHTTGGGADVILKGHHECTTTTATRYQANATLGDNIQLCLEENKKRTVGLLILVDNAARWRTHLDHFGKPTSAAAPICEICDTLNEGVHQLSPPVPVRTIIAGTPGTIDTVRALTSNRLPTTAHYRLHGVPDTAIQQIILDHLRLLDAKQRPLLPTRPMPWELLREIATACEGNVWHASKTGYLLQMLYRDHPTHPPSEADVRAAAVTARTAVHKEIGERIRPHTEIAIACLAAVAARCDNRLPREVAEPLVAALSSPTERLSILTQCVEDGLIEFMRNAGRYPRRTENDHDRDHYRIPIPCLISWIVDQYRTTIDTHHDIIETHIANMRPVPEWTWSQRPVVRGIPAMPRKTATKYISGQAVRASLKIALFARKNRIHDRSLAGLEGRSLPATGPLVISP